MRYAILLVPLLALLTLACNGGGEAQPTATQSPAVSRADGDADSRRADVGR